MASDGHPTENLTDLLRSLENYDPLIPDDLTAYYLQRSGVRNPNVHVTRLVSAAAHKFIGEVASDALQFCKIRQAGSGKEMKARGPKEKKLVLTTEDLAAALKEYGVNVRKQDYFVDGPTPQDPLYRASRVRHKWSSAWGMPPPVESPTGAWVEMYERGATEEGGAAGERRDADAEQGREEEKELQEQQAEQEVKQEEGVENEADVNGFSGGTEECYRYNHGAADEVDVDDHDGDDEDEEDEEDGDAEEEDGDADEALTVDNAIDSIGELLLNVISFSSNLSARFLSVSPPVLSPLTHSLPLPLLPPQPPPGFGPYQLFLVCYTGLAWLADAMEMILLSFVGPA
ncbi:unnamed protein product, partial [Closterium sp. NIES-54]